jgi:sensor histidine kinase YesM
MRTPPRTQSEARYSRSVSFQTLYVHMSWPAFFDPSDSYFLFTEERGYHKWALAHISSCLYITYVIIFCDFSELMWEVVVCFFGGIVYHCLLNFLFIISIWLELIKLYLNACFFFFIGVKKKHKGFDNKWWHDLLATCDVEVEWMKKKF